MVEQVSFDLAGPLTNGVQMPRRKILVADDQEQLRAIIRKFLSGQGFEVIEAADGIETLRQVARCDPDLLVLDVMMPELDGFEVLERLQSVPGTRRIPVVFLTARAAEGDRVQGLSLGAHDYIAKPFSLRELKLRIDRLLETKEQIDKLVDYGQRDELTGLPRRSYFELAVREAVSNPGSGFGMVFVVFEGLDEVTTEAGLEAVDEALAAAADAMQLFCDARTEACWIGPAHAAVLQRDTDPIRLKSLSDALEEAVQRSVCRGKGLPKITVSCRWEMYQPGESAEEFVSRVTGGAFSVGQASEARRATPHGIPAQKGGPADAPTSDIDSDHGGGHVVIPFPLGRRGGGGSPVREA